MSKRDERHKTLSDADAEAAAHLRRSAEWLERDGRPVTAMLFRNAAWIAAHGCEWLQFVHRAGKADDTEVKP